jgi:hypothetical protein
LRQKIVAYSVKSSKDELGHIRLCLTKQLAAGRVELLKLDEDRDEIWKKLTT